MSVSSELYKVTVVGDGSTPSIAFNRKVFASADVKGFKYDTTTNIETALVNGVDFTVAGAGETSSGVTITPAAAIPSGTNWVIYTDAGATQGESINPGAGFPGKATEYALDKVTIATQEADGKADRALKLPISDTASADLPNKTDRANKLLGFDSNGNPTTAAKNDSYVSVLDYSAVGDSSTDNTSAFQSAIDALSSKGGNILVPSASGNYLVTAASLTAGTKVVNWILDGSTVNELDNTTEADLPGIYLIVGEYSLPETTFQANRNVYVHDYRRVGETSADANATTRQYAIHVDGFMTEDAAQTTERELRALSFDLGTDVANSDGEVRGIKGRVYATGGASNLRAIYGFADAEAASGFTGALTGMLATVYKNGNSASESVGVRAHMDDGCTAGFQVAGAGVAATDEMSYGFMARTGSGQPCLASVAYFMAHGGNGTEGQGDFLLLYESATSLNRADAPFIVNYKGQTLSKSMYSGSISSLADDAATSITPPAGTSGILKVWVVTASGFFAEVYYRVSGTPLTQEGYKGANTELTTGALTGTTGTDTKLTISSHSDGSVYIENRTGAARSIGYCWFTTF